MMELAKLSDEEEILGAMNFVKVTVYEGFSKRAGYLTTTSIRLLIIELNRRGFNIVRSK